MYFVRVFRVLKACYECTCASVHRLITSDPHIEEIDFEHNYIGDAAGREILHAMQQRRDGNIINNVPPLCHTDLCCGKIFNTHEFVMIKLIISAKTSLSKFNPTNIFVRFV